MSVFFFSHKMETLVGTSAETAYQFMGSDVYYVFVFKVLLTWVTSDKHLFPKVQAL